MTAQISVWRNLKTVIERVLKTERLRDKKILFILQIVHFNSAGIEQKSGTTN